MTKETTDMVGKDIGKSGTRKGGVGSSTEVGARVRGQMAPPVDLIGSTI